MRGRWAERRARRRPASAASLGRGRRSRSTCRSRCVTSADRARVQLALLPPAPRGRAASSIPTPSSIPSTWSRTGTGCTAPAGFTQYQCVLPAAAGTGAARRFLELLTRQRRGLDAVRDQGLRPGGSRASCPSRRPGISIALDIPVTRRHAGAGRRARTRPSSRKAAGSTWPRTRSRGPSTSGPWSRGSRPGPAVRRRWDPEGRIRSAQSVRLFGDVP